MSSYGRKGAAALALALAAAAACLAAGTGPVKTLYPYLMEPAEHPDYLRHHVRAPGRSVFGDKTHFISLRDLRGPEYKERIAQWVDRAGLGDFLWPHYRFIYQDNLKEIVGEIKRRGLYLFDIWPYIPGSGPGRHEQFVIPDGVLDLFRKELGDHWLGMDNGEQDGRYVNRYAPAMHPMGGGRVRQYLNFQRHFEEMGDQLGNRLATLVSLNFGHYFLKEGVYTLIGAETAQALPNSQIYYSFIRGAGKQYGVRWFGNASVFNRWGWKNYDPGNFRPEEGTSLSLLKRLMYTQLFYDCAAVGFEVMWVDGKSGGMCPIAKIQRAAAEWCGTNGDPGTMHTPVAFLTDFFAGWTFPRHLYSRLAYRVWGNLPYEASDYLTDNMLDLVYPGYQDASYFRDERGFIAPTPFGDIADCLLSDAPLWLLKQYPLLVVAGRLRPGAEIKDKLEGYAAAGGRLVVTAGSVEGMPGGLAGVSVKGRRTMDAPVSWRGREFRENGAFALAELGLPGGAETVQACGGMPAVVELPYGKGRVTVIASPFAVPEKPQCALPVRSAIGKPLDTPYPMLKHVRAYMEDLLAGQALFETGPGLSLVTCVKNKNEYSVLITNSGWEERPFSIRSKIGPIASIRELRIDEGEMKAAGYAPRGVAAAPGGNGPDRIAGGGTRAFSLTIAAPLAAVADKVPSVPNPSGRALALRDVRSLKEEILSRPTFFEHYDRAVVDWRYVDIRDERALAAEAGWTGRQKLKISVDLTSGMNLYPDLRIVNNDGPVYRKSLERMKRVIDKMKILGADELIVSSQPPVENNYSPRQFNKSIVETLRLLCDHAVGKGVSVLYRPCAGRVGANASATSPWINLAGPGPDALEREVGRANFRVAVSAALLLQDKRNLDRNLEALKTAKVKRIFLAAPERDIHGQIWNMNAPVYRAGDREAAAKILKAFPDAAIVFDGLYGSQDEEYLDAKALAAFGR